MPKIINDEEVYTLTCKLLVKNGFEGMTTKMLAQKAAVDESSLFRKYGSKTKLVCMAVNNIFSHVPLADLNWTGDLREDLTSIVENYLFTAREFGPLLQVVMMELSRNNDLKESTRSVIRNISGMRLILEKYQKAGELKKGNSMNLLASLIGPLAIFMMNPIGINQNSNELQNSIEYVDRFLTGYGSSSSK